MTADVVGLYPSIPHKAGLKAFKNALDKRKQKRIPTEKPVNMAEFVLKKFFFQFNGSVKQKVPGRSLVQSVLPLTPVYIWMREGLNS